MSCEECGVRTPSNIWVKPMDELRFFRVCRLCQRKYIEEDKKWRVFRLNVLKRDNYTCRDCDSKNVLQVHHIERRSISPGLMYELSNCVTLCRRCHKKRHDEAQTWSTEIDYDAPQILCTVCGQHFHYQEYEMCYYCYQETID